MPEPTVFVIDDDDDLRKSVIDLLTDNHFSARGFSLAKEFLDHYNNDLRGCILLDVRMDAMSGPTLQQKLISLGNRLPIIFITAYGDVETAVTAMKNGAMDFINKPFHGEKLIDKVNEALEKNKHNGAYNYRQDADLTTREGEILDLLMKACTSREIGQQLGISPRTVEVHRQHILQKFKARSVTQLLSRYSIDS